MTTEDLVFSALTGFGFIMCAVTVIHGVRRYMTSFWEDDFVVDPAFWPGIASFSVFPLINTLVGAALLFYWVKFLRRRR